MDQILNGARAGVLGAIILSIWATASASGALGEASALSFFGIALGTLGMLQLAYGIGLGVTLAGWRGSARSLGGESWFERLCEPTNDRRAASMMLFAPIAALIVGAGTGVVHAVVTSKFARATFQSLGLTLTATALVVGVALLSPVLVGALSFALSKSGLSKDDQRRPTATFAVGGLLVLGVLVALVGGYIYAGRLQVFPATTLNMGLAAALLPPVLLGAMSRVKIDAAPYTVGVPAAGALAVALCAWGAWGWASSSPDMRNAVTSKGALVSSIAKQLQRFGDADGDGYASSMGSYDCDDSDPETYPGAKDTPGDGIDQDCSGSDAKPPPFTEHPAYKATFIAAAAGKKTANAKAQEIPDPPKNLVFVIVDTLRQDHLGYAGYERKTSPNIDALAAESSVFMDAYATAPHTPRSIPCMFFSRYPSHMKWRGAQYNYPKVRPENLGWFEVLADKGWKNYGMSSHFYFEEKRGMSQGFTKWDNAEAGDIAASNEDIAAPRIWAKTEPLIRDLGSKHKAGGAEPFSLFVHFFEPHGRWIGHKEHDFGKGETPRERHINRYDSEIAYVDTYIGKLVESLKANGLYEDTVIILTSDHGEAFKDHGLFFHGQNLYNEVIKVPLVMRVPGWKPRRIEGPISLIDLAPTHLDLVGLTIPTDFEGKSLAPAMLGQEPVPDRPVFSELLPYTNWKEHHKAVIQGDSKYVHIITSGTTQLFDLKNDPKEQKNLARDPAHKETATQMRAKLDAWMGR